MEIIETTTLHERIDSNGSHNVDVGHGSDRDIPSFDPAAALTLVAQLTSGVLVSVAGTALAAMMFLMAFDVICRYFFNAPIPGGLELVEYFMATIVPLSVAYCAINRQHVAVDLVVSHFPKLVRKMLDKIVKSLSIIFLALISWQNYEYIFETASDNLTSAVLKLPTYPFVITVFIGMSCFTIILFCQLIGLSAFTSGRNRKEV